MALVVEDGSGKADADAFVSLADCDAYCTAMGLTDWTSSTRSPPEDDEAAIRRATRWLTNAFTWKGAKLNGRAQALAFPRTGVEDDDGEEVASDEVPAEIVQACCIASAYERANPGGLTPTVTIADRVKREKIDVIETEYFAAPMTADAAKPILSLVEDIVSGLTESTSSSLVGTAVRG